MNITKVLHDFFAVSAKNVIQDSEKSFSEFFYDLNNPFNFYFHGHASINTLSINTNKLEDVSDIINILLPEKSDFKIIKANSNVNNASNNHWCSMIIKNLNDLSENDTSLQNQGIIIKIEYNEKFDKDKTDEEEDESMGYFGAARNADEKEYVIGLTIAYSPDNTAFRERVYAASKASYELIEVQLPCAKIYVLEKDGNNLTLVPKNVEGFELDIEKHYNDDFVKTAKNIEEWVTNTGKPIKTKEEKDKTKNKKLTLLHGTPGTGKTNYIKYLLSVAPNVKKIYIPPWYVAALGDPGFFTFIKKYSSSILIIEDAEKILLARDDFSENSAISVLLNLSDGILAEILDLKIIATFNTDEDKIDKALTRKGRLFTKYGFGPLSTKKTKDLIVHVYGEGAIPPKEQMTLAEIYNPEDNGIKIEAPKRTIGFGV